ncbi:OmpA family protein [Geothrix sp. 21YS21S-4]|uniref:OmpA family protein n=1 Tax=Geothrix sp. 21YS21S-4 TaxID=3068889 RepID=UPI0027BAB344|nr:OmpA family protein [Geothrix sp. 21YS21S-4]
MKNLIVLSCLAALPLSADPAPPLERFGWAQVQGAFLSQENSACVKDATGFGLGIGHWVSPRWGWELSYLNARLEREGNLWKAKEDHLDATALFRPFLATGRWIPFLRAGAGASRLESPLSLTDRATTRLNLMAGVGTQVLFGSQGLGSLEVRAVTVETSTRRQEFQALVGFGVRWGAPVAVAAAVVPAAPPTPEPAPAPAPEPVVAPAPPPAPEPAPVVPAPALVVAPEPAPLPAKIILGDAVLHFPNNGDALGVEAEGAIQAVAKQLKAYPGDYTLVVTGHTSSLGSKAHNKTLSLRRAKSVAKILVASGIPAAKITTEGVGPDQPVADNATREGQSRNRRVEIEVKTPQPVEKIRLETGVVDAPAARP